MTFALSGLCPRTGMVGVAVTTSSICVGSRCPWVRAAAGAVSTQNITLPSLGRAALDRLSAGEGARAALDAVMAAEPFADYRQVIVVDRHGGIAHHSGARTLGIHAVASGEGCVAAGNLLDNVGVPEAMVEGFTAASGAHLAERLVRALECGLGAGGEKGPVRSAALLVAHEQSWPLVDLRVDWDDDPVRALRALWSRYEPQMDDYVTRALDPPSAPSYGVPGDE